MIFTGLGLGALAASGTYLAWSDIVARRLPNSATALLAVAGLSAGFLLVGVAHFSSSLVHAVLALVVGFVLFATGVIGSGDAKYYAAVATWFPLDDAVQLLGRISLAGFVLAVGWLVWIRTRPAEALPQGDSAKLPFGLAIALGAVSAALGTMP